MRICFFARVESPRVLETVEFYRQDIEILRELGHEVLIARRWREIRWDADLFYVWWWTWALGPLALGKLRRKPVIITGVLDHPYPFPNRGFQARPAWQRAIMAWALRATDANVFLSRYEAEGVPRDFKVSRPRCIPLAVDTEAYCPGESRREDLVLTILWMEKYNVWRKCAVEIIECIPAVVAQYPEVRFVIAGERHSGFGEVEAAVRKLGVERCVSFPGVVSRDEKIDLMRRCRLYLQPTRYEGFGAAILEAMSCGAPVITNAAGSVPEVVGDAALLLADTRPETIARAVIDLSQDETRRAELSRKGRLRSVSEYSFDRKREQLRRLLAELGL